MTDTEQKLDAVIAALQQSLWGTEASEVLRKRLSEVDNPPNTDRVAKLARAVIEYDGLIALAGSMDKQWIETTGNTALDAAYEAMIKLAYTEVLKIA